VMVYVIALEALCDYALYKSTFSLRNIMGRYRGLNTVSSGCKCYFVDVLLTVTWSCSCGSGWETICSSA